MAWRDQMQRGSFRGVEFGVMTQSTEGGRRVARHEYPGRNEPWPEDLGRKSRVHQLELHLIGANYMTARDAMIDALEQSGPGELVHPWLGRMQVQVETYRLRESTRDGGRATFSVTFLEAGSAQFPAASESTVDTVDAAATAAMTAQEQDFADVFSTIDSPGWVATDAVSTLNDAIDSITSLVYGFPASATALPAFIQNAASLQSGLSTQISQPLALAREMTALIASVTTLAASPADVPAAYRPLRDYGSTLPAITPSTPSRQQQADNQQAIVRLVRQAALIEEARTSRLIVPESSGEAIALREDLAGRLDDAALDASDDLYLALTDLRAALVRDLTVRGEQAPRLGTVHTEASLPALVLAYQIYADASRDAELVTRNRVRHPGFVPGGTDLEVLRA